MTSGVYWAGLHPNSDTSSGPTIPIKHILTLTFSDVPTTVHDQDIYFDSLKKAILNVLASEWNINITVVDMLSNWRRSSLASKLAVSIVFTSISAGHGDFLMLLKKLDSPAFLEQLNALGFKAILLESTSTKSSTSSSSGECYMYPIDEHFLASLLLTTSS